MVFQRAHIDEGLDLEAVAIAVERDDVLGPERHVSVAKIGEYTAIKQPDGLGEAPVSEHTEQRHIVGTCSLDEARVFDEIGAGDQRAHEY